VVQAAGATPLVGYSNALMLTGAILVLGGLWSVLGINPEATRARFADQATGDHPLAATSD
jgi:hypothetical protein